MTTVRFCKCLGARLGTNWNPTDKLELSTIILSWEATNTWWVQWFQWSNPGRGWYNHRHERHERHERHRHHRRHQQTSTAHYCTLYNIHFFSAWSKHHHNLPFVLIVARRTGTESRGEVGRNKGGLQGNAEQGASSAKTLAFHRWFRWRVWSSGGNFPVRAGEWLEGNRPEAFTSRSGEIILQDTTFMSWWYKLYNGL